MNIGELRTLPRLGQSKFGAHPPVIRIVITMVCMKAEDTDEKVVERKGIHLDGLNPRRSRSSLIVSSCEFSAKVSDGGSATRESTIGAKRV